MGECKVEHGGELRDKVGLKFSALLSILLLFSGFSPQISKNQKTLHTFNLSKKHTH